MKEHFLDSKQFECVNLSIFVGVTQIQLPS